MVTINKSQVSELFSDQPCKACSNHEKVGLEKTDLARDVRRQILSCCGKFDVDELHTRIVENDALYAITVFQSA